MWVGSTPPPLCAVSPTAKPVPCRERWDCHLSQKEGRSRMPPMIGIFHPIEPRKSRKEAAIASLQPGRDALDNFARLALRTRIERTIDHYCRWLPRHRFVEIISLHTRRPINLERTPRGNPPQSKPATAAVVDRRLSLHATTYKVTNPQENTRIPWWTL